MEITIRNTSKIVHVNNVPARIWEGVTTSGIKVHCYVTRIAAPLDTDQEQFKSELQAHEAPSKEIEAIPLRLII